MHGVDGAAGPAADRDRDVEQPQAVVGRQGNHRIAELADVLAGGGLGRLAGRQDQLVTPFALAGIEAGAAHLDIGGALT
ncbi:hypothetical protein D3C85_1825110 [compost metagenome]